MPQQDTPASGRRKTSWNAKRHQKRESEEEYWKSVAIRLSILEAARLFLTNRELPWQECSGDESSLAPAAVNAAPPPRSGAGWKRLGSCWTCRRRGRPKRSPQVATTEPKQRPLVSPIPQCVRAAEQQKAAQQAGELSALATRITVSSWGEYLTWRWEETAPPPPGKGDFVEYATCWDMIWDLQYEWLDLPHLIQDVRRRANREELWVRGDRIEARPDEDKSPEHVLRESYLAAANCLEERHTVARRRRREIVNAWVAYSGLKNDFPLELCYLILSNLEGIAQWRTRDHPRCSKEECEGCRADEKTAKRRQAELDRRNVPL